MISLFAAHHFGPHVHSLHILTHSRYLQLFALLVLGGVGFPFPEDLTLGLAGFLYSRSLIRLAPALFFVYSGILIGDLLLYVVGRRYGRNVLRRRWLARIVPSHRLEALEPRYKKWGSYILLVGRHVPGIRAQLLVFSGVMRMPSLKFLLADAAAALLSIAAWGAAGYTGNHVLRHAGGHAALFVVFAAVVAGATALFFKMRRLSTRRFATQ